jgi:uncharacterized membrane protein
MNKTFNSIMTVNQTTNYKPQTTNSLRWLLVLSRVAFICNICFLIAFSIQMTDWIKNEDITSTIALIGYVMGFIINPLLVLCYLLVFIFSRKKLKAIPSWLLTANILFLFIQILYILYLNDKRHP